MTYLAFLDQAEASDRFIDRLSLGVTLTGLGSTHIAVAIRLLVRQLDMYIHTTGIIIALLLTFRYLCPILLLVTAQRVCTFNCVGVCGVSIGVYGAIIGFKSSDVVLERIRTWFPHVRTARQHDGVLRRVVLWMQLVDTPELRVVILQFIDSRDLGVVLAEEQDVAVVFFRIIDVSARDNSANLGDLRSIVAALGVSTNQKKSIREIG